MFATRLQAAALSLTLATGAAAEAQSQDQIQVPAPAQASADANTPRPETVTSVFELPAMQSLLARAAIEFRAGRPGKAIEQLAAIAARYPDQPDPLIALAAIRAGQGDLAGGLKDLRRAASLGFDELEALAKAPLAAPFRGYAPFEAFLAEEAGAQARGEIPAFAPAVAEPVSVADRLAVVRESNTEWDKREQHFLSRFETPPVLARRPVLGRDGELGSIAPFLNRLYARGLAAGNAGDLYDNRDRWHSGLPLESFPQLTHIRYGPQARSRGLDYGPNLQFEFDRITFGNSSTAITAGPNWRSQSRRVLLQPGGPRALLRQYSRNQIYVYPSKDDYSETTGDLMPANTPYLITSLGASYSDKPFLRAIGLALAALKPAVKRRLRETGLIAPTLQRLIRRTLRPVQSEADYLTARAHPSVMIGDDLDLPRLVKAAQALTLDTIPPVVRLTVLRERPAREGRDHVSAGLTEATLDTPFAIARVHRRHAQSRRMTLSARIIGGPEGSSPKIVWRVLQGDTERITISPVTEDGSVVDITVGWHDRSAVPFRTGIESTRVDIAAFAETGGAHSAPSFVSILFPPNERRSYGPDGRLLEIDHTDPELRKRYADPALFLLRDWRDVYRYADDGTLLGWTRHRGETQTDYTAQGLRVLTRDSRGRPDEVAEPAYRAVRKTNSANRQIEEALRERRLKQSYASETDLVGRAVPLVAD